MEKDYVRKGKKGAADAATTLNEEKSL